MGLRRFRIEIVGYAKDNNDGKFEYDFDDMYDAIMDVIVSDTGKDGPIHDFASFHMVGDMIDKDFDGRK